MANSIKIGQILEGKIGSYLVTAQVARMVWTATRNGGLQSEKVVIKTAVKERLDNERNSLIHFQGQPHIRQLVDEIIDPPSIVLQCLDDNLLDISRKRAIQGPDLKYVAKRILQAIQVLHSEGVTHTDIKPNNILVNFSNGRPLRFSDVELADLGDVQKIDPKEYLKLGYFGPHLGAHLFRSPEAMINLRWGPSTDIWSFGATLISLLWGSDFHIFRPKAEDAAKDDPGYLFHILVCQLAIFGPLPQSLLYLIAGDDNSRLEPLCTAMEFIELKKRIKPFGLGKDPCLTEEHREFILKIMKIDPRDRPTAEELLKDKWFDGVE